MEGTLATIMMFAGNFAPKNWAFCAGQTISIASNTALFSLLGTTYGGNGTTTFMLPNLQGRVPVGNGQGNGLSYYNLGQVGGAETETLTTGTMPMHTHAAGALSIDLSTSAPSTTQPNGNILASPVADTYASAGTTPVVQSGHLSAQVAVAGNSQPFPVMQPFLGMNFVICQAGIFPSRG